jgi:hypothetical protein
MFARAGWAACLVAALVVAACGPGGSRQGTYEHSLAEWPNYGDLAGLVEASDLIVEARVVRRHVSRDVRSYPGQRVPVAFTESDVQVERVLKGSADGELRVVQVGAEGPQQRYPEFPLTVPGGRVVLFLVDVSHEPVHADGKKKYAILAPVGLLHVQGSRLTTRAPGWAASDEAAALSLEELRSRVAALSRN